MKKIIFLLLPFLLSSCASLEKSVGLGVGMGLCAGLCSAQLANYNTKGNVVLALSGALIGGVMGALLHKESPAVVATIPSVPSFREGAPPLRRLRRCARARSDTRGSSTPRSRSTDR